MNSTRLAELLTAHFHLHRSSLHTQQAQIDCQIAAMEAAITTQTTDLAVIRAQQAHIDRAIALTQYQSHVSKEFKP